MMHKWKAYSLLGIVFDISNVHSHLTVEDGNAIRPHRGLSLPSFLLASQMSCQRQAATYYSPPELGAASSPIPQGTWISRGFPPSLTNLTGEMACVGSKLMDGTQLPFQELGQPRSPSTMPLILLRQTWPGYYISGTPQFLPSVSQISSLQVVCKPASTFCSVSRHLPLPPPNLKAAWCWLHL